MNVIVVGGGKVGYYLAETLLEHGHKPFVIETDKEICRKITNNLDIPVINGDGTTLVVRPSGTEPKLKAYLSASGKTQAEADEKFDKLVTAVSTLMDELTK